MPAAVAIRNGRRFLAAEQAAHGIPHRVGDGLSQEAGDGRLQPLAEGLQIVVEPRQAFGQGAWRLV
jgi:hypothetical protein